MSTERIMEELAVVPSETPLVVAVRHLAREYRNALTSLQFLLDSKRDLLMPLPDDHPVAFGVPLPHSLLELHRKHCEAIRAAIAKVENLVESMEAWADDIERTIRDAVRQTRRVVQNRSNPY